MPVLFTEWVDGKRADFLLDTPVQGPHLITMEPCTRKRLLRSGTWVPCMSTTRVYTPRFRGDVHSICTGCQSPEQIYNVGLAHLRITGCQVQLAHHGWYLMGFLGSRQGPTLGYFTDENRVRQYGAVFSLCCALRASNKER